MMVYHHRIVLSQKAIAPRSAQLTVDRRFKSLEKGFIYDISLVSAKSYSLTTSTKSSTITSKVRANFNRQVKSTIAIPGERA